MDKMQYNPKGITVATQQVVDFQCDQQGNLLVALSSQGTALSTSALVKTGAGRLNKVFIASHSSGTLKLWDALSATGTVLLDTYTYPAGSSTLDFGGLVFGTGLYATLTNTQSITILYN